MVFYEYYPISDAICHHVYNKGGCTFCGFKSSKRCVSKKPVSVEETIAHFDNFAKNNMEYLKKADRLIIAPNGSWFSEVPKELREHIYKFVEENSISLLKYECRATLFDREKARKEFEIVYKIKYKEPKTVKRFTEETLDDVIKSLDEINSNHMVSFGLEVADNKDLRLLNKGCCLDDYIRASNYVHDKGAKVCCNILIAPPRIENPIYKALKTVKFGVEELKAEEFLVMPCIPMRGTVAYQEWIKGRWNPVSATSASEVFRIIKTNYPSVKIRYLDLRVFNFHGRHGKFKRKPGKWSEEEKQKERSKVRRIAKQVFK